MSFYFIQCIRPEITYRNSLVKNNPVNLALCTSIQKGKLNWYPDNVGLPTIKFNGCDTEWAFYKDEERDLEFDKIANNLHSPATTKA